MKLATTSRVAVVLTGSRFVQAFHHHPSSSDHSCEWSGAAQKGLSSRRRRLARSSRSRGLLWKRQAHKCIRGLPFGVLRLRRRRVPDYLQNRHRIQRGGPANPLRHPQAAGDDQSKRRRQSWWSKTRRMVRAQGRLGSANCRFEFEPRIHCCSRIGASKICNACITC